MNRPTLALVLLGLLPLPVYAEQRCNAAIPLTTPTERFVLHNDGTATDRRTGRTWRRCAEGQRLQRDRCIGEVATYTWGQARERYEEPDANGWRLPTIVELASIVERACWDPAINLEVFPVTLDRLWEGFWSASPVVGRSEYPWLLNVVFGGSLPAGPNDVARVRLVRAGQ